MTDLTNRSELTDDQALAAFLALDIEDDGVSLESLFAQVDAINTNYGDDVEVSDDVTEEIALAVDAAHSYDGYELNELFELVGAIGAKYDYECEELGFDANEEGNVEYQD